MNECLKNPKRRKIKGLKLVKLRYGFLSFVLILFSLSLIGITQPDYLDAIRQKTDLEFTCKGCSSVIPHTEPLLNSTCLNVSEINVSSLSVHRGILT
jgi:hypothetical protein